MLGREGWAQLGWRLSMLSADNLVYCLSSVRFVISSRYLASLMSLAVEADVLFHCLRNMQIAEVVAVLSNTSYAAVLMFFLFLSVFCFAVLQNRHHIRGLVMSS